MSRGFVAAEAAHVSQSFGPALKMHRAHTRRLSILRKQMQDLFRIIVQQFPGSRCKILFLSFITTN